MMRCHHYIYHVPNLKVVCKYIPELKITAKWKSDFTSAPLIGIQLSTMSKSILD